MKLFIIVCSTIVFLLVAINFFVSLVIFLGEDYHVIDQIKIYEVFEEPVYKKVRKQMINQNYTILIGDQNSGVKNFIEHQANLQTLDGKSVSVKHYQSRHPQKQKILSKIKQTRFYLQFALGIDREQKTEVFLVNQLYEVPFEEIKFIKKRYPNDNIIIISPRDLGVKIKGFKVIEFPPVTQKLLKTILKYFYHMNSKAAEKLFQKYDHSIARIFSYFKRQAKEEDITTEQLIEVEQIEDMNEMSHEMAEDKKAMILKNIKKMDVNSDKSQGKKKKEKKGKK